MKNPFMFVIGFFAKGKLNVELRRVGWPTQRSLRSPRQLKLNNFPLLSVAPMGSRSLCANKLYSIMLLACITTTDSGKPMFIDVSTANAPKYVTHLLSHHNSNYIVVFVFP